MKTMNLKFWFGFYFGYFCIFFCIKANTVPITRGNQKADNIDTILSLCAVYSSLVDPSNDCSPSRHAMTLNQRPIQFNFLTFSFIKKQCLKTSNG